jgi:hypothetical protein
MRLVEDPPNRRKPFPNKNQVKINQNRRVFSNCFKPLFPLFGRDAILKSSNSKCRLNLALRTGSDGNLLLFGSAMKALNCF